LWKQEEKNIRAKDKKTFYIGYSLPLLSCKKSIIFQSRGFLEPEVYLVATAISSEHHIPKQKFSWLQQQLLSNIIFQSSSLDCSNNCFQASYSKQILSWLQQQIASKHHRIALL
jgi:hypothetical protein